MKTRRFFPLIFLCMIVCLLPGCSKSNKKKYEEAKQLLMDEKLEEAEAAFSELKNYEDSNNYILYITALKKGNEGDYHAAASNLKSLGDFINSKIYSIYYSARELEESKDYAAAVELYDSISVSAKYSCGFSNPLDSSIIVDERYLDYFTTIMEDRLWQLLAKPLFQWLNRSDLSMNVAKAA